MQSNAFHNTLHLSQPELSLFEEKAIKQDDQILSIYKDREGKWYTPYEIQSILKGKTGKDIPITSCRRSISNLCKAGELLKSCKAVGMGIYGVKNHLWTFNRR